MPLSSVVKYLQDSALTGELINRSKREDRLIIRGANRASRALITTSLAKSENTPLLVIVPTLEEASRWYSLLELMGWERTFLYPTSEGSPYERFDSISEIIWGQLQVLSELISGRNINNLAIVATERSLQPHLPPRNILETQCISVNKTDEINLDDFAVKLTKLGYKRLGTIEQEGTWSRRGDIIDIYPVSSELPIRLEFFGDELVKLREFDPNTQRSLDEINQICLTPTSFAPLIAEEITNGTSNYIEHLLDDESLEALIEGVIPEGIGRLMGIAWNQPSSILEYIPKHTCVVIDEKKQCYAHGNKWLDHVKESYKDIYSMLQKESKQLNLDFPNTLHREINQNIKLVNSFYGFELAELNEEDNHQNSFDLSNRSLNIPPNQFGNISQKIKGFQNDSFHIWILSAQPTRTVALLEEHDCIAKFVPNVNDYPAIERILEQKTPVALKISSTVEVEGIIMPAWRVIIFTDKEFFGQQSLVSSGYVRRRGKSSSKTVNPNKIQSGDYVVHRNHGIGQFLKIEKHALSGEVRDYLVVQYLDGKLSVAADQLGSLGRFRSTDGKKPRINKMGGATWEKVKERAKKQLKKVAIDLVKLYAQRSKAKGYSFPNDGPWQKELEDSFPYEATPDQVKAVTEVKKDMERNQPMDRLVCGDVGFGKTEVAIRAIFKAITAGKQIALLAPTTVLAQQHWRTISDRFAPYPIKVSLLNRFRTTSEKKVILNDLKEGKIDAVIGTHQILSKNIQFKQLGLLVIDEEQRFGVNQKEKIKALKKDVDVLTLSATPIPRTLYMSLSGVREMSLITTPPPSRRPIKTHLSPLDDETIRSAICQELDRGGQIFYVVPRVDGIENVASKIRQMIPQIKLIIAHGQMGEGELESSMVAFNAGEAELMLCTTIVESGLDIPRVNTILIEDGHKFGLSQLYQLRGRVGRSGIQAHAWIFYPSNSALNDAARQRLRAIQEFAQLGSGYQLAMRDMEIRGVGNLLGVEQSGQLEVIGFDLYLELLQESLAEIQGQDIPNVEEAQIDLHITAFIPGDWITNTEEKISAYRAATECNSTEHIIELAANWTDRYGTLPGPVISLLEIMKLKLLSKTCGFLRIKPEKSNIILETEMEEPAFRLLRQALPKHLQTRLIYQSKGGKISNVYARGLGTLAVDKQVEQLVDWLALMIEQIPSTKGLTKKHHILEQEKKDKEVLSV